jgi:protein-tyrosine phosphatase
VAVKVLMVCLGNICRSPTAEAALRALAARHAPQLALTVDSAGTADYHLGKPPDPRSQAAAARRGYDLSGLRARQVQAGDFEEFDLLLAMDKANWSDLQVLAPPQRRGRVRLFLDYAPGSAHREVPDPYYGGPDAFEQVLDLAEQAAQGVLDALTTGGR